MIEKICITCGKPFKTWMAEIKKGKGKYCSLKCFHISLKGKKFSEEWKIKNKEHIKKLHLSNIGRKHTEEAKKRMSIIHKSKLHSGNFKKGFIPWNKGKKLPSLSEEHKKKISISHIGLNTWAKGKKRKPFTEEHKQNISENRKGKPNLKIRGKNNGNWKEGISPIKTRIWHSLEYIQWRQKIFIRDDFACQDCGDNTGNNLNAHHKKSFDKLLQEAIKYMPLLSIYEAAMLYSPLWNISNGRTLCKKCHKKYHRKRH